jgi:hypothetical protein
LTCGEVFPDGSGFVGSQCRQTERKSQCGVTESASRVFHGVLALLDHRGLDSFAA